MAKIRIGRDILHKARVRGNLNDHERAQVDGLLGDGEAKGAVSLDVREFPLAYLKALLEDARLSPNQRAVVSMQIHGMHGQEVNHQAVYRTPVSSPVEFGSVFVGLGGNLPNCELFLNGRWYPVILAVNFVKGEEDLSRGVIVHGRLSICEMQEQVTYFVSPTLFLDETGGRRERSVLEILAHFGLRALQTSAPEFNLKLLRAERAAAEHGRQVLVTGPVVLRSEFYWWSRLESRSLGSAESPRKAIVEPELEVSENERGYYSPQAQADEAMSRLPFVRVFSLDLKAYTYVDVDDVGEYAFDEAAMGKLHLPPQMLSILGRVFNTPTEALFGDLIDGKHGGVVILASGRPGVGKTLTAEVYAEQTRRPLYVLELGELGTQAAHVEENLRRVFTRVARWKSVLQFDECEIFLTERGDDLERSAIVGIFLRLLDYYQGILFLTTNRAEALDHAVLSRVMLKLEYPDLDREARAVIWRTMFASAGVRLVDASFMDLAEVELNGRQIRNLTRLARVLHPQGQVTMDDMREVIRHGAVPLRPR